MFKREKKNNWDIHRQNPVLGRPIFQKASD